MRKRQLFFFFSFALLALLLLCPPAQSRAEGGDGWLNKQGKVYYIRDGKPVTGIQQLGGHLYLFDRQGVRQSGWHHLDGKDYYCDPAQSDALLTGMRKLGRTTYLFNDKGEKSLGWHRLKGKDYYFDPNYGGGMVTGKRLVGKTTYLFCHDGDKVYGWHRLDGKDYYFDPNYGGGMVTGKRLAGKTTYLFCHDGYKVHGWHRLDGRDYYFDPNYGGGMVTGKRLVGKATYLFSPAGYKLYGWHRLEGKNYYFDPATGVAVKVVPILEKVKVGWRHEGNQLTYITAEGKKADGWLSLDTGRYFFNSQGQALKGWQSLEGKKYYFDPATAVMYSGRRMVDGKVFTFSSTGVCQGAADSSYSIQKANGRAYLLDGKGQRVTAKGLQSFDGMSFYFMDDGHLSLPGVRRVGERAFVVIDANYNVIQGATDHYQYGADVSHHNGDVDFQAMKKEGIDFVIIRDGWGEGVSGGKGEDRKFEQNYRRAREAGLEIGIYHYSYARTPESAKKEAQALLSRLEGKQVDYPIYFDFEDPVYQEALKPKEVTAISRAFCDTIEDQGYLAGIYSSQDWLKHHFEQDLLQDYSVWIAKWADRLPTTSDSVMPKAEYPLWQYDNRGSFQGNKGDFDLDVMMTDLPGRVRLFVN